jgi:DNA-binding transcriptional ArsR family regulator
MMCDISPFVSFAGMEDLNIFTITSAIADSVRLSVMMYLIRGSASVTEMINHLEVSQSNLSNHLAVLKNANLIKRTAVGRQKIYELANTEVAQLIELLLNMQHTSPAKKEKVIKPIQFARTCYDHLAGKLGVAIFEKLLEKKGVQFPGETAMRDRQFFSDELELGPDAEQVFGKLGIDLAALKNTRRKFAYGCLDLTERTAHLAGALGASVCNSFLEKKWIIRKSGTRAIAITTGGKQALKNLIGLDID